MEKENLKVGSFVITDAEREYTKIIGSDSFTLRIPTPLVKTLIGGRIARAAGVENIKALKESDLSLLTAVVTLNEILVKTPDWWKGADQCMDMEMIDTLYTFYLTSENEFQEKLKKNNSNKDMAKS
jgi:hypothetical protein